jgi:hypothetical protein
MTRSQKKTQNLRQPQDEQGKKGNQKMPGTGKIYMEVEKEKVFPPRKERRKRAISHYRPASREKPRNPDP